MSGESEYQAIVELLASSHQAITGQMFGKQCIKVGNKAAVAFFQDCLVFKLPEDQLAKALDLDGSTLWDPSGKGRAMKEWAQVPTKHNSHFKQFANAAADYVSN